MDYYVSPIFEEHLQNLFGLEERPDIVSVQYNFDFAFMNSHPVLENIYPTNENTAMVGGLHVREAEEIKDKELKKWLDEAKDGAILVSYGSVSNLQSVESLCP